jgi:polyribonucleotide nucleotidyltransferase
MIYNVLRPKCICCGKIFKRTTSDLLPSSKILHYCSSKCESEGKQEDISRQKQTDSLGKMKAQIVVSTTNSAKEIRKYSKLKDDGIITEEEFRSKKKDLLSPHSGGPKVGQEFDGIVTRLMTFGAFVEYAPGREGLVHISEMEWRRVEKVEDVCKPGDVMKIKLIKIDDQGRFDFSRKALLPKPEGYMERPKYARPSDARSSGDRKKVFSKR